MAIENVPRCQHVKVNGVQCGSPALRRKGHCYFHERVQYERKLATENKSVPRNFGFPLLEDANSIQVAIMKTIQMLGSGCLDAKTAGLMLYGLQLAISNLRHVKFESEKITDVVVDEDTVDLTRLNGPQWASRDFTAEENEKDKVEPEARCSPAEHPCKKIVVNESVVASVARRRERKRNLRPGMEDDGKYSLARHLLEKLIPGWQEQIIRGEEGTATATRA